MSALWEPYKCCSTADTYVASIDTSGLMRRKSEQTFDRGLSRQVMARENGCARGGQTPGAAPLKPLDEEWHAMSLPDIPPPDKTARYGAPLAIPTAYRGCRFRSRLEARWAVFFDHLDIGWRYEPQGYELGGRPYLPDFLLECGTWVEVKGTEDALDYTLMRTAAIALPKMPATDERGPKLLILGAHPIAYDVSMPGDYGWLGLDPDGRGDELLFGNYGFGNWNRHHRPWWYGERTGDGPWLRPAYQEWETDTSSAYAAANGARFEHGESGAA